jgi:hypothetical protein
MMMKKNDVIVYGIIFGIFILDLFFKKEIISIIGGIPFAIICFTCAIILFLKIFIIKRK